MPIKILNTNDEIREFLGRNPLQSISIRVTQRCNLRCRHCYAQAGPPAKNELTFEETKQILIEAKDLGAIRVFFGGGEPFVRNDIIEIFEFAKKLNYSIYTSSNGTVATEEMLKKVGSIGLKVFQVSIDGMGPTDDFIRGVPGTFAKAVHTLELAKKHMKKTKVALAFALMKYNCTEAKKMMDLAFEKKADIFALIPLFPAGRMQSSDDISTREKSKIFKEITEYYIHKKKHRTLFSSLQFLSILSSPGVIPRSLQTIEFGCGFVCTFPNILGFDANGDVYPCDGLIDTEGFKLSNIREKSLGQIWDHPVMAGLREVEDQDLSGVCKVCQHLKFCQGGCRAGAIKVSDSITAADPVCQSFYDEGVFPRENLI